MGRTISKPKMDAVAILCEKYELASSVVASAAVAYSSRDE